MREPTKQEIITWATRPIKNNGNARQKFADGDVIEQVEGCDLKFHLTKIGNTTYQMIGVS